MGAADGSGHGNSVNPLAAAADRVREAAKWAVAAFAAIGALLTAGLQLSTIGSLEGFRLWVAVGAAIVAFLATAAVVWWIVQVMMPSDVTLAQLAHGNAPRLAEFIENENPFLLHELAKTLGGDDGLYEKWRKVLGERADAFSTYYDAPTDEARQRAELADGQLNLFGPVVTGVLDAASYEQLRLKFRDNFSRLFVGVLFTAVALTAFAWAANPPESEQPPASLRYAELRGANLNGASLKNADLTGADLTDADLRGATLAGAMTEGVTWRNTLCPDGVLSNTTSPNGEDESCVGHLVP
jgi:hypothetical protein